MTVLQQALSRFSADIAVDLGSTVTRVFVRGRGLVVESPSVVAVERAGSSGRVVAVGQEAKRMVGRTPEHMATVHPIREGIVGDYALLEALLRDALQRALTGKPVVGPRLLLCVPSSLSEVERKAVQESARAIGARQVQLISKSVAAALGAGLPVRSAGANLVLDLGGGLSEVSVLSLGGLVDTRVLRVSGAALDQEIVSYVQGRHKVLIGARSAEELKLAVGTAMRPTSPTEARVTGRDLTTGIPREVAISGDEVHYALYPVLKQLVEGLRATLAALTPELAADISDHGVVLTGGTALLGGLDVFLRDQTGLPMVVAEDPRTATIMGAGALLDDDALVERLALA